MTQKSKNTRTQIADLPEIAVELSKEDLQAVVGGSTYQVAKMVTANGTATSGWTGTGQCWDRDSDSDKSCL